MELLQERIRREGRVLPGNIVKVDGFLNHRVDTRLLEDIADEFAKYFDTSKITVVLTAEASGIPELRRTTRDEPDYDKLMHWRLGILKEHGLGLKEIDRKSVV